MVGVTALGTWAGLGSGCKGTKGTKRTLALEIAVEGVVANRRAIKITANSLEGAERMTKPYGFYIQGLGSGQCIYGDEGRGDHIFIAFDPLRVEYLELEGTRPRGKSWVGLEAPTNKWVNVLECDNGSGMESGASKTAPTNRDTIASYPYPGVISRDETYAHMNLLIRNTDGTELNVALRINQKALEAR